jgi:hypothetical protein
MNLFHQSCTQQTCLITSGFTKCTFDVCTSNINVIMLRKPILSDTLIDPQGSTLAAHINTMLKTMFFLLIIICISLAIAGNVWLENHEDVFYVPEVSGWPEFGVGTIGSYCIRFLRYNFRSWITTF